MDSAATAHEIGRRAWDWIHAHHECFRPDGAAKTDPESVEWMKPVGELAMVAGVVVREGVAGSRQAANARQLLDFAWHELLADGDVLDWCQREHPLLPGPVEHYAHFRASGYRNPRLEATLRTLRPLRASSAVELLPTRWLSVATAEHQVGLTHGADLDTLLRRTWLGRQPEPWTVDQNTGYDITHTVFYLTGWGAHSDRIPPDLVSYLQWWSPVWKQECIERFRWDLLAEWLAVDACLPTPILDETSWRQLAAGQTPAGALPADGDIPTGEPTEVFELVYHPTLAATFAATLATSRALTALLPAP